MLPGLPCRVLLVAALLLLTAPAGRAQQPSDAGSGLPAADEVVARYVTAIGGADALRAVQSIHASGTFSVPAQGIVAAFELFPARPARLLYRVTVPGVGRIENGYDGQLGWMVNPISGPELLRGPQLEELADDAWFDAPLHESDRIRSMETLEETVFDGRRAYKVRVTFHTGREQFEYFDVATGLQIGTESVRTTPQGRVPTVSILRDDRAFGPLLQATTVVQRAMGFEQIVTLSSCEYDTVADATFALPPEVMALLPR